ncbi:MAG: FHA domain-containing protein, partial [Planctomycetes bacterium]|nr:FHA domain-containing protein [Planctomycetota bacterium]
MGIIILTRDGEKINQLTLGARPMVLGSSGECDLVIDGGDISPRHLVLAERDGIAGVKNLAKGSTFLNNSPVEDSAHLASGDCVSVGPYVICYYSSDSFPGSGEEGARLAAQNGKDVSLTAVADADTDSHISLGGTEELEGDYGEDEEKVEYDFDAEVKRHEAADSGIISGEFIEPDAGEDIDLSAGREGCKKLEVDEGLMNVIRSRLGIYRGLDKLEEERNQRLKNDSLPESVKSELRRQSRELGFMPNAEKATASIEKVRQKVAASEEAQAKGQAAEKSTGEDGEEEQAGPVLEPEMRSALGLAVNQWELFIERESAEDRIVEAALTVAKKEPLYWVLQEAKIDANKLFAYAVYVLALESIAEDKNEIRKALRKKHSELEDKSKGMFSMFRRGKSSSDTELEQVIRAEEECAATCSWISREINGVEKPMVAEFWSAYEDVAVYLVKNRLGRQEEIQIRAFLRYGLLGCHPWFILTDKARSLLESSAKWLKTWDDRMGASHVLYADEYLCAISHRWVTPSIDEDLELNMRNPPGWRADKAWRKIIFTRIREGALREIRATLDSRVNTLKAEREQKEFEKDKLIRGAKDYKEKFREYSQKIQHCRVEAARFERAIERIDEVYLPAVLDMRASSKEKLVECGAGISPESLVRREVKGMRKVTRLTANLKEPFMPFTLRDSFKPESDSVNSREIMLEQLAELERRDPGIFVEPLMPVKKKSHRLEMRYCPVILLTPGCGFLGYSWNPRSGSEIGRIAVPSYCPRPRMLEKILDNIFADFRWDTSKAS